MSHRGPSSPDLRDATGLINEAVHLVASYENSTLQQIVDRVQRWDRDILRTRFLKMLGHEDTLPLEIAAETGLVPILLSDTPTTLGERIPGTCGHTIRRFAELTSLCLSATQKKIAA